MVANPQPSYASFLGIALEATPGTAVAPTMFLPVKTMTPMDKLTLLPDEGLRGAPVKTYSHVPGPLWAEYDFGGDVYADSIGWPLVGLLGDAVYGGTYTGSGTTTLSSGCSAGATSISTAASIANGTRIQIDSGVLSEVVVTSGVPTGAGPYTIPVPPLKYAHLSAVTVQPVTTPYSTAVSTLCAGNFQPPTYTFTDWNSNITGYQLAGSRFSEVGFKFAGQGKLEYTAKATSLSNATTTKPSFANNATQVFAGWQGIVKLGGSTIGSLIDGEITAKRPVENIDTADGSQAPYANFGGVVEADGKMTIVMEADTYRAQYVAGTSTSVEFNFLQGSGGTTQQVLLHASTCVFTDAKVTRGKAYVELEIPFTCDANTTDVGNSGGFSPLKATIQNAVVAGTYK